MSNSPRTTENLGFLTVIDHPRHGWVGGYLVLNSTGRPLEFSCTTPIKPNRAQEILYGNTLEPFLFGEQIGQTLLARSKTPASFVLTNSEPVLAAQNHIELPIIFVFGARKKNEKKPPDLPKPLPEMELSSEPTEYETVENRETNQKPEAVEPQAEPPMEISEELNESLKSFGIDRNAPVKQQDDKSELRLADVPGLDTNRWKEVKIGQRSVAIPCDNATDWEFFIEELKYVSRTIDLAEPFTRIRLAIEEAQRAG